MTGVEPPAGRVDVSGWTFANPDGISSNFTYEILKRRYANREHSALVFMRAKLHCWDRPISQATPVRDLTGHNLLLPPAASDPFMCPHRLWTEVDQQTDWAGEPQLAIIATIWFPSVRSQAWAVRQVTAFAQERIVDEHGVAAHVVPHAPARIAHNADFHVHVACTARLLTSDGFGTFAHELLGNGCQLKMKAAWDRWWKDHDR